jgi:hypothetical protein
VLAGKFANAQDRKARSVSDRFVEQSHDAVKILSKVECGQFKLVVLRSKFPCGLRGASQFAVLGTETNGKTLYSTPLQCLCIGKNGTTIETAAEQDSNWDISAKVQGNAFIKSAVDLIDSAVKLREISVDPKIIVPVTGCFGSQRVELDPERATSREFAYLAEVRTWGRKRQPSGEVKERVAIQLSAHPRQCQECLQLARESKPISTSSVVQRLLPKMIARKKQHLAALVINAKSEHPAKTACHLLSEVLIEMHKDFGIAARPETVALAA